MTSTDQEATVSEDDAAPGVIAQRLQRLWEIRPASLRDVADAITAETGREVSAQYLSQLRNGQRTEPSYSIIAAIATYFGVTPDYFYAPEDTARRTEDELRLLHALRDAGVRTIALSADGLSPASLATITEVIRNFRASEGLPEAPTPRPGD
jgi:transcriptional regulator with XRE-family HTH domain